MSSQPTSSQYRKTFERKQHAPSFLVRFISRRFAGFSHGTICIHFPNGESFSHTGEQDGPGAILNIRRWRGIIRLFTEGDIGLAAAYMDGDWTTEDLKSVLDYGLANEQAMATSARGANIIHTLNLLRHRLRVNSRKGSKRNIAAHYDLGNQFYSHWLDKGMQYSSALYENNNESLASAQDRKLQRIESLLDLEGGENVLEIGCGWGAIAERLVTRHNCTVTGITLSKEQAEFARNRLDTNDIADKAQIELRDYRDINQTYDRIVSIEMFEAVGIKFWPVYFQKVAHSLNTGGNAVLQVITIADRYFEQYQKKPDFIQKYIFPGGMLPTKSALRDGAQQAGLQIVEQEHFGKSYEYTLEAWRQAFHKNWDKIAPLGFDDRFRRMWHYYLCYCEAGFKYGSIDVGLYKFVKTEP